MPRLSGLLLLLVFACTCPAAAQPRLPPPTLASVMSSNMVARARVRWSKVVDGQRVEVVIGASSAERRNPLWSQAPAQLPFGLSRNQELERLLKRAHLGAPTAVSTDPKVRTLEILGLGSDGWVVVGAWSLPRDRWRKAQPALFNLLEPLFDVQGEPFVNLAR